MVLGVCACIRTAFSALKIEVYCFYGVLFDLCQENLLVLGGESLPLLPGAGK
jgi:hypothetical protein